MINVSLGGTLHTDIFEAFEEAPKLRTVLPRKRVDNLRTFLAGRDPWIDDLLREFTSPPIRRGSRQGPSRERY